MSEIARRQGVQEATILYKNQFVQFNARMDFEESVRWSRKSLSRGRDQKIMIARMVTER